MSDRYIKPDWFTKNVFNTSVAALTRLGISVWGSRVLRVKGRKSGEWRSSPVNLLTYQGARYLVAPRGQTQWVRNIRVNHDAELMLGNRSEKFHAVEIEDEEKVPILRDYLAIEYCFVRHVDGEPIYRRRHETDCPPPDALQ